MQDLHPPLASSTIAGPRENGGVQSGPFRFSADAFATAASGEMLSESTAFGATGVIFPARQVVAVKSNGPIEDKACGVRLEGSCAKVYVGDADDCDVRVNDDLTCGGCRSITDWGDNIVVDASKDTCYPLADPSKRPEGDSSYTLAAHGNECVPFNFNGPEGNAEGGKRDVCAAHMAQTRQVEIAAIGQQLTG